MDEFDLKHELNAEQYEAVMQTEGALLIIAGAGSGKTRVITYRIANMLKKGIPQSQILALTFTNKAAREMEERVKEMTGKKLQLLTISTFHAFGVRVLRQEIGVLGWRENFSIYDETDRNTLIKDTARELKYNEANIDVYKLGCLISDIKTNRREWDAETDVWRELYESYEEGLKLYNAVDFDDLITLPIRLFREHPEILQKYRERYKYVMVDEFQDTSRQQYELMRLLSDKNIAVVGDDDQSIYSWRGADYQNIVNFEKDFPSVREIKLEQNYRSTGTILDAANGVISHNKNRKEKKLWSGNGNGKPIEIFYPENDAAEADFILECISSLAISENRKYSDFCVLMRSNSQSRALEEAFLSQDVPYTMSGGTSFFQRKEIKDVISFLRVIANHDDDVNLLRIINTPRRGIGRTTLEKLNKIARENSCSLYEAISLVIDSNSTSKGGEIEVDLFGNAIHESKCEGFSSESAEGMRKLCALIESGKTLLGGKNLSKKVRSLLEEIGYFDFLLSENPKTPKAAQWKILNVDGLLDSMEQWENNPDTEDSTLYGYLNRITLLSRDDFEGADSGKVNLMTIHASKGLEFPVVFIAGAEDDIIPHERAVLEGGEEAVEEERRLFYVAITRARDKLFISACQARKKRRFSADGKERESEGRACTPSRFLKEIPQNLIEYHEAQKEVSAEEAEKILSEMVKKFRKPIVPGFSSQKF